MVNLKRRRWWPVFHRKEKVVVADCHRPQLKRNGNKYRNCQRTKKQCVGGGGSLKGQVELVDVVKVRRHELGPTFDFLLLFRGARTTPGAGRPLLLLHLRFHLRLFFGVVYSRQKQKTNRHHQRLQIDLSSDGLTALPLALSMAERPRALNKNKQTKAGIMQSYAGGRARRRPGPGTCAAGRRAGGPWCRNAAPDERRRSAAWPPPVSAGSPDPPAAKTTTTTTPSESCVH